MRCGKRVSYLTLEDNKERHDGFLPHASRSSGSRSRMTCDGCREISTMLLYPVPTPSRSEKAYASQSGSHVARRDAVDANVLLSPFNGKR